MLFIKLTFKEAAMYLVEKIGHLILITLEGAATNVDMKTIEKKLKTIIDEEGNEEMVVSLSALPPEADKTTPEIQESMAKIIELCRQYEIRIYSYCY